jgi:hypothetical protein
MKKLVVSFLTIGFLSGVSGCTYSVPLYRGERLPSRDSAKLYYTSEVEIRAFDGNELIMRGESPDCFEMLSGQHSVTVVYLGSGRGEYKYSVNPITLKFYAKPGAKYCIVLVRGLKILIRVKIFRKIIVKFQDIF